MKYVVALTAASLVAASCLSAKADGLPERERPQTYETYVAPFTWTGFYLGGHVGWEEKRIHGSDFNEQVFQNAGFPEPDKQRIEGWLGGAQVGYNHQFGRFVVGTEFSASFGDVSGSTDCFPLFTRSQTSPQTFNCDARQDWTVQWLNKLGVSLRSDNRLLAYGIGGVAVTNLKVDRTFSQTIGTPNAQTGQSTNNVAWNGDSKYVGAIIGAGLQHALTERLSLGVEYLHGEYASGDATMISHQTQCFQAPGVAKTCGTNLGRGNLIDQFSTDTVRMVLNYKFGEHHVEPLK